MRYEAFDLVQLSTGKALYSTHATNDEILDANRNLRIRAQNYQFYPAGTFHASNLTSGS